MNSVHDRYNELDIVKDLEKWANQHSWYKIPLPYRTFSLVPCDKTNWTCPKCIPTDDKLHWFIYYDNTIDEISNPIIRNIISEHLVDIYPDGYNYNQNFEKYTKMKNDMITASNCIIEKLKNANINPIDIIYL